MSVVFSNMIKCGHQLELENSKFRMNRRWCFFILLLYLSGGFPCHHTFQMLKVNMGVESAMKKTHVEKNQGPLHKMKAVSGSRST